MDANTTTTTRGEGHVGHITRITLGKLQDEGLFEQNNTVGDRHYKTWRLTKAGLDYRMGGKIPDDGIKHAEDLVEVQNDQ